MRREKEQKKGVEEEKAKEGERSSQGRVKLTVSS